MRVERFPRPDQWRLIQPPAPSRNAGIALTSANVALIRLSCFVLLATSIVSLPIQAALPTDRTELLDGTVIVGQVQSIDSNGGVRVDGQDTPLPITDLRRIERPQGSTYPNAVNRVSVLLIDESLLLASRVTCRNDRVQIEGHFGTLDFPVAFVQAARLQTTLPARRFEAALVRQNRGQDTLFVTIDDQLQEIEGYLEALDAETMTFEWQNKTRTVPRDQVHGFVLAKIEDPPAQTGRCRADLVDGSTLAGTLVSLTAGRLTLDLAADVQTQLDWRDVTRVTLYSPRMIYLSDMKPADVIQETIVTLPREWQADRSVEGFPLTLKGRHFDKGIGVSSRTLLTFATNGRFHQFVATLGIDDETEGRGDCLFVVRGDGRQLYRQRVRGSDEPRQLVLDISGVRELTLLVEPGEGLDMADHADWCDARLIKPR